MWGGMSRRCAFCGSGDLTLEHVIPRWVSRHSLSLIAGADGFSIYGPGFASKIGEPRPASLIDIQVKRACRSCNNGWMAGLESTTSPLLKPMLSGNRVQLDAENQKVISRWVLKTAMALEFLTPARQFAAEDRAELRRGGIPEGHSIFLAARQAPDRAGEFRYAPLIFDSPDGHSTKFVALTISLHHLVAQVISSGKTGGWLIDVDDHGAVDAEAAIRLLPSVGVESLSWPPRFLLSELGFQNLVRLVLPKS